MNKRLKLILSISVFLFSLLIYYLTSAPDVTFTDSGELAGVCATLGIAHPTGYPLFSILGHLWTKLPLPGTPVRNLNLFAAFCTAASGFMFYHICILIFSYLNIPKKQKVTNKISKSKPKTQNPILTDNQLLWLAAVSALLWCFGRTIWQQGTSIEVYSLQLVLMFAVIYLILKAVLIEDNSKTKKVTSPNSTEEPESTQMVKKISGNKKQLYFILTAFMLGLSFSNHMTTILLLPGIFFLYFCRPGEGFNFSQERIKFLFKLLIPFAIGISLYIYLPLRSSGLPEFNWGWVHRGFDKFLYHIEGKQYQVWMFSDSKVWGKNLGIFFNTLPYETAFIGLLAIIIGFIRVIKKSKSLGWFIIFLIAACLFYTMNYSIHDIEGYFALAFAGLLLFAAAGLFRIAEYNTKAIPLLFILPIMSLAINFKENDCSDDYLVSEYTRTLGDNLRPNALVISAMWDYWCSSFWYKQRVEGYRRDVSLVEKELLRRTWYIGQLRRWYPEVYNLSKSEIEDFAVDLELFESGSNYNPESIQRKFVTMLNSFIAQNYGKRPIYLTFDVLQTEPDIGAGYQKVPEGHAFRLELEKKPFIVNIDNMKMEKFISSARGKTGYLDEGIKNTTATNIANIGRYALSSNQTATAEKALRLALQVDPKNEAALQGMEYLKNFK